MCGLEGFLFIFAAATDSTDDSKARCMNFVEKCFSSFSLSGTWFSWNIVARRIVVKKWTDSITSIKKSIAMIYEFLYLDTSQESFTASTSYWRRILMFLFLKAVKLTEISGGAWQRDSSSPCGLVAMTQFIIRLSQFWCCHKLGGQASKNTLQASFLRHYIFASMLYIVEGKATFWPVYDFYAAGVINGVSRKPGKVLKNKQTREAVTREAERKMLAAGSNIFAAFINVDARTFHSSSFRRFSRLIKGEKSTARVRNKWTR